MKKTLLIPALLGLVAFGAQAQSHVTVYGLFDTGLIKETGRDVRMGNNIESRLGFKGSEELGNGNRAFFVLERRFNLNDGSMGTAWDHDDYIHKRNADWQGPANVGLSGNWGAVSLGRVVNLTVENYSRIDPFGQYSVASGLSAYYFLRTELLSNAVRYDSPVWNGASFGASYTLGADDRDHILTDSGDYNDGYNLSLKYDTSPVLVMANFNRLADSHHSYTWNLGGAYAFGNATVSLGYEKNRDKSLGDSMDFDTWIAGLKYRIGQGTVNASFNRADIDDGSYNGHASKYALGYTYDLSRRTALYGMLAWTDFHDNHAAWYFGNRASESGKYDESITGVQIGITHRF